MTKHIEYVQNIRQDYNIKSVIEEITLAKKTVQFQNKNFIDFEAKEYYKYLTYLVGGIFVVLGLAGLMTGGASLPVTVIYYISLIGSLISAFYCFIEYQEYLPHHMATKLLNNPVAINAERIYRLVESHNTMAAIWNHARNGHMNGIEDIPGEMMDYPERLGKLRQMIDKITTRWDHERERQLLPKLDGDHPSFGVTCAEAEEVRDELTETARQCGQTRTRHDHIAMLDTVETEARETVRAGQQLQRGIQTQAS